MDAATRDFVRRRADERCEYCRLHQVHSELRHHVEHIVAKQHGGSDDADNLALACHRCNLRKGPNLTGIFVVEGVRIMGVSAIGRATVHVLDPNDARRLELRAEILKSVDSI